MIAPPIPEDELQRQAALNATKILDSAPEERFDRITRLARRLFGVPIALISLVDTNRQWFKSKQGLAASETPRAVSFCGHAILRDEPLVVADTHADGRFADNPLVTGDPRIRFYAGHPLSAADGSKLGTLCIISDKPREFSADDRIVLHTLATMAESELVALDPATTDTLTGLANLRGFLEIGEYTLRLSKRLRQPVQLLLVHLGLRDRDAAHDVLTTASADLTHVVRAMVSDLQEADLVARIGPLEFVLLAAHAEAEQLADEVRLREFVRRVNAEPPGAGRFTFDFHPLRYDPRRHASLEEMLSAAERGLKEKRLSPKPVTAPLTG